MRKLLLVIAVFVALIVTSCNSLTNAAGAIFEEPKLALSSVDITGINFNSVNLLAKVDVENPNRFSIPLPKIDWELFVNSSSFIQGSLENSSSLQSNNKTVLNVPFSLSYEELLGTFSSLLDKNEAAYDLKMGLSFPFPLIKDKVYNLDFSGLIPMLKIPEISFQSISRKSLGTTMEFLFNWEVDNKNNFAFDIDEFVYNFNVNNKSWAEGKITEAPKVKANGKTVIPLNVSISSVSIVQEIVNIINRGSSLSYDCTGNVKLLSDLTGQNLLNLPMNITGTTRIR